MATYLVLHKRYFDGYSGNVFTQSDVEIGVEPFLAKADILGHVFLSATTWEGAILIINPEVIGLAIAFGYSGGLFEKLTKIEPITSEA